MDFKESLQKSVEEIRNVEYEEPQPKGSEYNFRYDDLYRGMVSWELSCALITRDWGRVRNALLMLGEKPVLIRRKDKKNGKKKGDADIFN